jgi:hypothetical protein
MIQFQNWIKEYPKLEEVWNSIPEPAKTLFEIQIDVFVHKQMPKALLEEWLDYIHHIKISPPIEETEYLLKEYENYE